MKRHAVRLESTWTWPPRWRLSARYDASAVAQRQRRLQRALLEALAQHPVDAATRASPELIQVLTHALTRPGRDRELAALTMLGMIPKLPEELARPCFRALAAHRVAQANPLALFLLTRPEHPLWIDAFEHASARLDAGEVAQRLRPLVRVENWEVRRRVLQYMVTTHQPLPRAAIENLLADARPELRRYGFQLARVSSYRFTWYQTLLSALAEGRSTERELIEGTDARGYRWDVRVAPTVRARPYTPAHRVAFAINIMPDEIRRVFVERLVASPDAEARELGAQLLRAEQDHARQLLMRVLLARGDAQPQAQPEARAPKPEWLERQYKFRLEQLVAVAAREGIALAPEPADADGVRRASRVVLLGVLRALLTTSDVSAELMRLIESESRLRGGTNHALAGQLLYLIFDRSGGARAERCLALLMRQRAAEAERATREALTFRARELGHVALREGRNLLPRAELEQLARPLLDDADPRLLHATLLIFERFGFPVSEDRLRRFLIHRDELVRRRAARLVGRAGLQMTWPDALLPALLQYPPAVEAVTEVARARGYRYDARAPAAITAAPFSTQHIAAVAILRGPLEERRALTERLRRHAEDAWEVRALVDQLDAAELEHRRQLLVRVLSHRAARVEDEAAAM